jgi:hypothetical protein
MARERNNVFAMAADVVDLALDTAGTIGSAVGSIVGLGNSNPETSEKTQREEVDNAVERVATSLRQEAEAVIPPPRKKAKSHRHKNKAEPVSKPVAKTRSTNPKTGTTTGKGRSARKAVR